MRNPWTMVYLHCSAYRMSLYIHFPSYKCETIRLFNPPITQLTLYNANVTEQHCRVVLKWSIDMLLKCS